MMDRNEIATRILDAFPTGQYGLLGLLRILDVVATEKVETAAVECVAAPRLLINPAFVEAHANTSEKLMMLVMHELHHVLLGHTRLFSRPTPAWNLVFDAVINAMLCRMFPTPSNWAMFTDYYSDQQFPQCLLRPPQGWDPAKVTAMPPGLNDPALEPLQAAYRALYSETGADYYDLFRAMGTALADAIFEVRLLGSHDREVPQLENSGVLFDCVREIVERWPQPPHPIAGRSFADMLRHTRVRVEPRSTDRENLTSLIRRVAPPLRGDFGRSTVGLIEVCAPSPRPDRRSTVLRALGGESLLHRTELPWSGRHGASEPVHVYVDVSGSVREQRPALYAAVCACRELVHPTVHLFSTTVRDVSLRQFGAGECETTNGTDIACVAEHIRKHRIRRAVLLTDGCVGKPRGQDAETLRQCVLGVALTPGYHLRGDLEACARFWIQLKGKS